MVHIWKPGMCRTVIWDVQYGKIRVKYDKAFFTNTLYDTSLLETLETRFLATT
jgi:hypothetical protein